MILLFVSVVFISILVGMAISVGAFGTGGKRAKIFEDIYFSIEEVDGIGVVYTKKGDYSAVLKMENPVRKYSADTDSYYEFTSLMASVMQVLGDGYAIHKQDIFVRKQFDMSSIKGKNKDAKKRFLSDAYFRFFNGRSYTEATTYLTITQKGKSGGLKAYDNNKWRDFNVKIQKVADRLKSGGITCRFLGARECQEFADRFFAVDFKNPTTGITDFKVDSEEIGMGDQHVKVYSLLDVDNVGLPGMIRPYSDTVVNNSVMPEDLLSELDHIPGVDTVIYNQVIFFPNQKREMAKLDKKKNRHASIPNPSNLIAVEDIKAVQDEVARNGKQLVYAHYNLVIKIEADKDFQKVTNNLENIFAKYNIHISKRAYNQLELFVASFPGNCFRLNQDYDQFLTISEAALCLMYKEHQAKGDNSPLKCYYTDRQGVPMPIDTTGKEGKVKYTNNSNFFVLGPSGSGKSFFMNTVMRQYYEQDTDIVIVDTGDSYEGLCSYFEGTYISYSKEKPISMNPFKITKLEYDQNFGEKKNFLKSLIFQIFKGAEMPSKIEDTIINQTIVEYFEAYFNPFEGFTDEERQKMKDTLLLQDKTNGKYEEYDKYKEAGNVENILMQVIQTADADGVARLFKVDDYNITGYISNYIKEMQGQYYTQRWYIAQVNSGSQVLATYKPSPPTNTNNNYNWPGWTFKCNSQKKTAPPYPTLTTSEYNQLKSAAESETGWNATKKADYEKKNPGHTITLSYQTVSYNYIWDKSGGTFSHSKHERGKHFCVYMTVTDTWNIKDEVYEEIFDSQTMNLEIFKKKMESRLKYYQDQEADKEGSTLSYKLCSDPPRYYAMADEKKMEGCNSVSFTATCDGGASLGEGSFNWKENGKQGSSLNEKSKEFAMRSTPDSENNNVDDLLTKQKEYEAQISTLKQQISSNDKKQQELIKQIQQAQSLGNQDKVKGLRSQYDSITNETASLKQQLNNTQKFLNELNNNVNEYYEDLAGNLDGPYRIPSNMKELEGMYQLQWTDDGNWVEGSSQYIFVRHGYCPSVKSTVTYTATLTLQQKPKYFLGIRIHRAILSVDFKLTSEYSSDNVVAVIKLDMSKSEKERADEVNAKLKELMEDMPNCSINIKYNYASKADDDEDEDGIHLLWASDRLDVAREVDYQLTSIYSQLVILEKVMQDRETILDFLKHKIFDVVSRASRGAIAEYALTRWEDASMAAMKKQAGVEDKKENTPSTQKSDKNV